MLLQITLKRALFGAGAVVLLLALVAGAFTLNRRSYEAKIVDLQNQVASRDKTIEVKDGVYQKLALQSQDLEKLLGDKDQELKSLKDQLDKQGAQILTANTLVVKLRKDLQASSSTVSVVVDPAKPGVKRVDIDTGAQLDPFLVTGDVQVDCDGEQAIIRIDLSQRSPISFSVVVSQDKDGTWRSSATSSTKSFEVDISLAAVNPYMLEPKWYEKIGLDAEVGIGTNPGLLASIGATYEIGHFEIGPKVWVVVDHGVSPYFGAQLAWHPFKR